MAVKRKFTTFSLSFLDIMSCGLGAVILIFLIIKHDISTQIEIKDNKLQAEVNLLEQEIQDGELHLVKIKNTLSLLDQDLVETSGLAKRINDDIEAIDNMIVSLDKEGDDQQITKIKEQIQSLLNEKQKLEQQQSTGNSARQFAGESDRQYLTGLKLGGDRILILLDVSASMLDSSIVNIIIRRNMSEETQKAAKKWQRAIRTVEWLVAKFPIESQFQLYLFNTDVRASINETHRQWISVANKEQLNLSIKNLRDIVPKGGTSLEKAFREVSQLHPLPDNILLITDGLPTQGIHAKKGNTISGEEREELFIQAVNTLPDGIPVNVMLWPMEGDPMAASSFWKLALHTSGSFISPSIDWP